MPHDFFLSYALLDDDPYDPNRLESKWVTTFREVLARRLQFFIGREADVFFDCTDVSGNAALTRTIETALDDSHLFVAISTPAYYNRPWCKLERKHFIARLGPKPVLAERIFVIHTSDVVKPQTWQSEFFPDVRGYYFFRENKDGLPHTLGHPELKYDMADPNSYFVEIERLARDLAKKIRELESPVEPRPTAPEVEPATNDFVFLAEVAFRSHPEREELRIVLRNAGFDVRPAASLSDKPAGELMAAVADALAFVQIVSPVLLPGGLEKTYDHMQLDAARTAGVPIFRWRAPDLDIAVATLDFPGYREFACSSDVREQLLPKFEEDVLAAIKDLRARRRMKHAAREDERLVTIAGEPADVSSHHANLAQRLQGYALGHYFTDSPAQELEDEEVRGFLILYGGSKAEWVRDQLRIVRRLPKTRRRDLRVGVYFCPPPPDLRERPLLFDMPSFQKIRWDDQPSFEAFAVAVAQ